MLRPLPWEAEISCTSLLAHAVLFRGLHERIPAKTVGRHATKEYTRSMIIARRGGGELNAHNGEVRPTQPVFRGIRREFVQASVRKRGQQTGPALSMFGSWLNSGEPN
jgi:hypothetical protein